MNNIEPSDQTILVYRRRGIDITKAPMEKFQCQFPGCEEWFYAPSLTGARSKAGQHSSAKHNFRYRTGRRTAPSRPKRLGMNKRAVYFPLKRKGKEAVFDSAALLEHISLSRKKSL